MSNILISAICVSHSSRFGLLQRAILNFESQDYADKELIIAVNQAGYADSINAFIYAARRDNLLQENTCVSVLCFDFATPTEAAQKAVMRAQGEVLVCWDDDNQSAPHRLTRQLEHLRQTGLPSYMTKTLYYFHDSAELYFTDHAQPSGDPSERCAVASAMLYRRAFPLDMSATAVQPWSVVVLSSLAKLSKYSFMTDPHDLFMVGANGDNWRGSELHRRLATNLPGTLKSDRILETHLAFERIIKQFKYSAAEVFVCGKDAVAFTYTLPDTSKFTYGLESQLPSELWQERIPGIAYREYAARDRQDQAAIRQAARTAVKHDAVITPSA